MCVVCWFDELVEWWLVFVSCCSSCRVYCFLLLLLVCWLLVYVRCVLRALYGSLVVVVSCVWCVACFALFVICHVPFVASCCLLYFDMS